MLKLYLITQGKRTGYDTYDSAVVAAENAEIAANIHPSDGAPLNEYDHEYDGTWVTDASQVTVTLIGTAAKNVQAGVICASFNAG